LLALLLACLLDVPAPLLAAPGDITTVAGGGVGQGPALSIGQVPRGLVVSGPLVYVADSFYNIIRRLDTRTGNEIVVAGTGLAGFSGDGGPAIGAELSYPSGVAVDAAGSLFIADTGNWRIRKVDTAGRITTVAGGGSDGLGDGGPATSAEVPQPLGVAVDAAGNLFIAEGNWRIRKVDPAGTITTAAGGGCCGGDGGPATSTHLSEPVGVAVDAAGNLFIAERASARIRMVDPAGTITTVAGTGSAGLSGDGGAAISAQLSYPSGVAVDAAGNLFIADMWNQRIRKVDPAGTITTVAGGGSDGLGDGGSAMSAQLSYPSGVAVDAAGNLFIADTENHRIREVDAAGTITTVAGNGSVGFSGDGGPAISASLFLHEDCGMYCTYRPNAGVAVDAAGNLFIADAVNDRIRKVDTAGTITTVAGNGLAGFSGDGGPAISAQLSDPSGVAVDATGNLFIAEGNRRIRKVDPAGTITTVVGSATSVWLTASGVAADAAGNLFIADAKNQRIREVDTAGTITTVAGTGSAGFSGDGGPATRAQLSYPSGVAVDAAGNLFIAERDNARIRKVDPAGTITTVAGGGSDGLGDGGPAVSAQLSDPSGVAVDAPGNLFIADAWNQRIRKVDTAGTITTVAGTGSAGFSGDGGPAISAQLYYPYGVAVDAAGNLFIADTWNQRIRMVEASTPTCVGDCDNDGHVTIDELLTLVNIALGNGGSCQNGVPPGADVDVALILQAVNKALNGCSGG
jgi:sugar lactone lactonase YvrE